MAVFLGIDTGGTYTDAVLLDDEADVVTARAKSLTTRPDLSIGIAGAVDAVLDQSRVTPKDIAMVSLSTTLATNALVEGQAGPVALILIGFDETELQKAGLSDALGQDQVVFVSGGHTHSGSERAPLDENAVLAFIETISPSLTGVAIAGKFATRNPAHEAAARDIIRRKTGLAVTCSHELSQVLGGPKRALTALLNARLIGLIERLISATQDHLRFRGIDARLMVVRGDGALISSELARDRPIETILSGPAASIAGAQWLTGECNALVSDIGGTTTDICLLRDGLPKIDPRGAKVGPYRTMVEAVAMRTFGLGGDSEVHIETGLSSAVRLGPRRVMPVSLLAVSQPDLVHDALDRALACETPAEDATRFVQPQWSKMPDGLDPREFAVAKRLEAGPLPFALAIQSRVEAPALARLVKRGLVVMSGVTPSDASHVLGRLDDWDRDAAEKALSVFARNRVGSGNHFAANATDAGQMIIDQLTNQTSWALLETAFAEEGWQDPSGFARHEITNAGLRQHQNILKMSVGLALPVIGLGASAASYYGAVGRQLSCDTILPADGGVANAIGAVVGQVSVRSEGTVTSGGEGAFLVHLPDGPQPFSEQDAAFAALRECLTEQATRLAHRAGIHEIRFDESVDLRQAEIDNQTLFIEATMRITAQGRPRITN